MRKFKMLLASLFLSVSLLYITGCDDSATEVADTELAPAQGPVDVNLSQASGFYATIYWSASTDEALDNFVGYMVKTYEVNESGTNVALFDSTVVSKPTHNYSTTHAAGDLVAGKRYKTYIYSYNDDKEFSSALASNVYGGVVVKTGAAVDQTYDNNNAQSGYGWGSAGEGAQVAYGSANAASIDLVCRKETNGEIFTFYSPASLTTPITGARTTKFLALTADDWTKSNFSEPTANSATVAAGNVVLIKTQDNEYVKVKINTVAKSGTNAWYTVTFDYKYQNVAGLRAAKQ